jgi:hypothetical protein
VAKHGVRRQAPRRAVGLLGGLAALALAFAAPAGASHDGPLAGQWHLDAVVDGPPPTTPDSSGHDSQDASAATVTLAAGGRWDSHLAASNDVVLSAGSTAQLAPARVTLVAWVRHSGSPGDLRYVAARGFAGAPDCTGASYALFSDATTSKPLSFYILTTGGDVVFSPSAPGTLWDGAWHMVAGTFDGAAVRLFVDGSPVGPATSAPGAVIDYDLDNQEFTIDGTGQPAGCAAGSFPGGIDEVRVYDRALSAGEIGRLAAASATPPVLVTDDATPPQTSITGGPADGDLVADAPSDFSFTSTEPGSTFQCRAYDADGAATTFAACTSPYRVPAPPEGRRRTTFEVRATDPAGNVDSSPARRTVTVFEEVKSPKVVKCDEVDVVAAQGRLVRSGCSLAAVEKGKVRCVHTQKLKVTSCRFTRRSGSFVRERGGHLFAVVGQAITKKGRRNGPYVVAASLERKKVECADVPAKVLDRIHGKDTAGSTTSSLMAKGCTAELILSSTNASGAKLQNVATREVCTSTPPSLHPDTPQLTRTPMPGVFCYTGRGAGLNDPFGQERDANGNYLISARYCHFAMVTTTTAIVVGKRPATSGTQVIPNSPTVWRPVSPAPVAN